MMLKVNGFLLSFVSFSPEAFDSLDPFGNITIKWDIMSWTPDGYVVSVMALLTKSILASSCYITSSFDVCF